MSKGAGSTQPHKNFKSNQIFQVLYEQEKDHGNDLSNHIFRDMKLYLLFPVTWYCMNRNKASEMT